MHLRQDALAAAAEWITLVEREAWTTAGLVATVGAIAAEPGAANVIAGLANLEELEIFGEGPFSDDFVRAILHLLQRAGEA